MQSCKDAKSQFNKSLSTHIKQLTATFASPITNFGVSQLKDKPITLANKTASIQSNNNRAKTPQPRFLINSAQESVKQKKTSKEDPYNRLYYDYLKVQRNKTAIEKYAPVNTKYKVIRKPEKNSVRSRQSSKDHNVACPLEFNKENLYPSNMEDSKYNNLIALVNKERETVNNMKAELQRVCIESRAERNRFQKEIEELNVKNTELRKLHIREKEELHKKYDIMYSFMKALINEVIDKFTLKGNTNQAHYAIEDIKTIFIKELENVSRADIGIDFSEELSKLENRVNRVIKADKTLKQTNTKLEQIQEETPEHKTEQSLLLRALEDINSSVNELSLKEDLIPENKVRSNSSIQPINIMMTSKAMKQLEEIKARILNRQRKIEN